MDGRSGMGAHWRPRWLLMATAVAAVFTFGSITSASGHFPVVQGTTTVNPTSGGPGTSVTASAAGVNTDPQFGPYALVFADSSAVASFEQGGAEHKEACAHGEPISDPTSPDADGKIGPVKATIPPASPGKALMCFVNSNYLSKPVEFSVQGGGMMPPYSPQH